MRRTLSLLRKVSRSTRLWESPRVPLERYELRPCLCVFVARFDRRIFYYSSKTDSSWGCIANVTVSHLLMARPRHCFSATPGCVTPGWALPTQYPVQLTNTVYTHGVYWVARQEAGGQRGAGKERGRIEGGRDGGSKGREGGSDDVRQGRGEGE